MGYRADVVGNGLEVLEALSRQSYDVVLMDVQMPEMDGLTAARRIAQERSPTARPRIIAMTANAMQGDREMCLKVGMDDYISKPIRVEELVRALSKCREQLLVQRGADRVSRLNIENLDDNLQPSTFHSAVLDATAFQQLREMLNKDEVLVEVVDRYLEETPNLLQAIAEAVVQGEADVLQRTAHTLKSTSALLGATGLSQLLQELETISLTACSDNVSTNSIATAVAIVSQLKTEYERVRFALLKSIRNRSLYGEEGILSSD
jgi:CheY-like chemotaxis protein